MVNFRNVLLGAFLMIMAGGCISRSERAAGNEDSTALEATMTDPLPSWNDGPVKQSILAYVKDVTDSSSPNHIPQTDRIATFDNDGTLWSEQPVYFQFFFAIDRVKALATDHPEWKHRQPFKALLEEDIPALAKQGERAIIEIVMTTHAGMTTEEFGQLVKNWVAMAKHPVKNRPYTELIFQPMLELIRYLQGKGFKTFIVSGGGVDFMRVWVEEVYGIPKDQVVGSTINTKYDYNNGQPVLKRLAELDFIDDKEGKPVGIQKFIGRKPVFACGNSDGDLQMLQWAASNKYKNFELYVHHTDAEREWAYDRKSHIGTLDKGLDEAKQKQWALVDMKADWKIIYPFEMK